MANFIIIATAFCLGRFAKLLKRFPANSAHIINQFVILISLPSLILAKVPELLKTLDLTGHWWIAVSMPWLLFFTSWLLIGQIGVRKKWSRAKTGALILTCGLGNTSFVGFPLLQATLGPASIPYGVIIDQLGSFLILATLGTAVASFYSGDSVRLDAITGRLFSFPPFISLCLSILWFLIGLPGETTWHEVFEKISMTLVPLTLFSVGFQTTFHWDVIKRRWHPLVLGLLFKMALMPMIFYIMYFKILGHNDLLAQTTFLESAMATQITAAIVVAEYQLDVELANLMVSLSIPISLFTVPMIDYLFVKS